MSNNAILKPVNRISSRPCEQNMAQKYDLKWPYEITWCKWVERRCKFCDNSNTAKKLSFLTNFQFTIETPNLAIKLREIQDFLKWGAFSRWSFDPNFPWGSIETTAIEKVHSTLGWWVMRRDIKRITCDHKVNHSKNDQNSVKITIFGENHEISWILENMKRFRGRTLNGLSKNHNAIFFQKI